MSDKRISVVILNLAGGGAEKVALLVAEWLLRKGLEVELVCYEAKGEYTKRVPRNLKVVDLRNSLRIRQPLFAARLAKYLRTTQNAVILSLFNYTNVSTLIGKNSLRLMFQ